MLLSLLVLPAHASDVVDAEVCFLQRINEARAAVGSAPLALDSGLSDYARRHSAAMAAAGALYHSDPDVLAGVLPQGWRAWGENVGFGGGLSDCGRLHEAFMNSDGHRRNLLNERYNLAGIGVTVDGNGTMWTTHVFVDAPQVPPGLPPFIDDDGSVHEPDIIRLAEAGITKGCDAVRFCPDSPVTRGQMAAFLRRALGLSPASRDFFTDDDGSPFEADINAVAAAGITSGCAAGRYCADQAVTRGQMAAFLRRALGLAPSPADFFTDDQGSMFEADINALAAAGITSGCAAGKYCPDQPVTRGQMATFLVRAVS
jgi:hypothetical protein